jgi:biopolymer transport protein ExbD
MKLQSGFEKKRARVEMLPLIDVVFLLLVFFIYAFLSMVVHRGMAVDLPVAKTSEISQQDYIDISITSENQITVNREVVTFSAVIPAVKRAQKTGNEPIFINGDRQADLGIAVELLDQLRANGIQKVLFAVKEAEK